MNKVLIYSNANSYSAKVRRELEDLLVRHGKTIVGRSGSSASDFVADSDGNKPEVVMVIGGDGTMLNAIRSHRNLSIPFVGIDTGTLGFLNTIMPEHLDRVFDVLDSRSFRIVKYPTIRVEMWTVDGKRLEDYAFNEVIIRHYEPRLLYSKVYFNGKPFNYFTGDGFVISTPMGATGYAIWTGGAVVHTDLPAYQITPLAPNDNSVNRPMSASVIIPAETVIDIEIMAAEKRRVAVAVDGMHSTQEYVEKVKLTLDAVNPVEIIRSDHFDYFDLYRRKIIDKDVRRKLSD